ncbi:MAG: DUF4474 domain-containing protein [Acutalibacteraceae bacterium]
MKKYSKIITVISSLLVIMCAFSGCGLVDALKGAADTTAPSPTEPANDSVVYDNSNNGLDSAVITPAENGESTSSGTSAQNGNTTTTVSGKNSSQGSSQSNTKKPQTNSATKASATEAPTEITEEDLKNMSIEEIQDLLFNTTDPNTAGKILEFCGFEYDPEQCIYTSTMYPLQRYFGFNVIYDMVAPRVGMIYSTKRVEFKYQDKQWMIQLWKGQYGITAGAEIGLYNKPLNRPLQYDSAGDDELFVVMSFDLYNGKELLFKRAPERHWWLTGFKLLEVGVAPVLTMDITLTFDTLEMANAFYNSLKKVAASSMTDPITYKRTSPTSFKIVW